MTQSLRAAPLEEAKAYIDAIDFSQVIDRMVKKDKWKRDEALKACAYYRNYLFLVKKHGDTLGIPPSEDVDQFWHNHILDTNYWNNKHPNDIMNLQESRLDEKLDHWVKKMTGIQLNQSPFWNHFKDYQTLNNKGLKHTVDPAYAIDFLEMATLLNKFQLGIARILFELHIAFKKLVPVSIIRGMYFPDVVATSV